MGRPDFIHARCTNTELPTCAVCQKEFLIPLTAVEMFAKDGDKAIICIDPSVFDPDPSCPMCGSTKRFIKTEMLWTDLLTMMDGDVRNIGDIKLKEFPAVAFYK